MTNKNLEKIKYISIIGGSLMALLLSGSFLSYYNEVEIKKNNGKRIGDGRIVYDVNADGKADKTKVIYDFPGAYYRKPTQEEINLYALIK